MSFLSNNTNNSKAHDAILHSPVFADAMRTLDAPATRRYVARLVPAADVEDVLAEARLRLWSALLRAMPDNGAAFAMALVKTAIAQHHRTAGRRVATSSMTTDEGTVVDVADPAAERPFDHLIEVDALHGLLADLRNRGATPQELQRLIAFALADGDASEAVTHLPTPCRPATLNQSMTSLRKRAAA